MGECDIYIIISRTCDGTHIARMTGSELLKRLHDGYYGEGVHAPTFWPAGTVPDLSYEGSMFLVIKGDVVVPKAVQVATEYVL